MAKLGIIGGLGPMATAYFMELIIKMTDASNDQEHLPMLVYHCPNIPDRTEYILDNSQPNPLPQIVAAGKALASLGADTLAIPCITAHCFHKEIEQQTNIQTLNAICDSAVLFKKLGIQKVGIMATSGTLKCNLFQNTFTQYGIQTVFPSAEDQNAVMDLIYNDIKKGKEPNMDRFASVKNNLIKSGSETVLLGCTELSLIKKEFGVDQNVMDILEILAASAITACGKKIRKQYILS